MLKVKPQENNRVPLHKQSVFLSETRRILRKFNQEQCLNKDEIDQASEQQQHLTQTELNFISFNSISDKFNREMNSFSIF